MSLHYGLFGGLATTDDPARVAALDGYARGLRRSPVSGAPPIWGVGRTVLPEGERDTVVSWRDMERDVAWAARMLDEIGVGAGDLCIYSLTYRQSAQFWPWLKAGFDRGARVATSSIASWDAGRQEMYLRLFALRLLFGVSAATLDALEAQGHDIAAVYARPGAVAALPDAWTRLSARGLKPWRVTWLGPILAVDPCDGSGARFDTAQWTLEALDGEIAVTSHDRATAFERARTGVHGRVSQVDGEARFFSADPTG